MKMMLLSLFVVLSLVGVSQQRAECPKLCGVNPFDYKKFEGLWYVHARPDVPIAPQTNATCWSYKIESNEYRINLTIDSKYRDGSSKEFSMRGRYRDQCQGAQITSFFKLAPPDNTYHEVTQEAILATDYKGFAIHYACVTVYDAGTDTFSNIMVAEIWGRKTTMDHHTLELLKEVASSITSIGVSDITNVDLSGCAK